MSRRTGERGQVLPLVAICLAVLLGFAGLAVDVGYLQYEQRQQQSAADAGALGGAEQLLADGAGCLTAATDWSTAAKGDTARNGFTDGAGGVTVSVAHPVPTGPFTGDPCAVQVTVFSPHPTFFSKLFGM
ncbi:MAG: pilus assembly protein TadG-related protein, partial [Candidatus Tumulicola sp.]